MSDPDWKHAILYARPDMEPAAPDDQSGDGAELVALMERFGGRCWYCGCRLTHGAIVGSSITREHLLPKARGGGNEASNIVAACRSCNVRKQAKTVEEYRASLSRLIGTDVVFYGEGPHQ